MVKGLIFLAALIFLGAWSLGHGPKDINMDAAVDTVRNEVEDARDIATDAVQDTAHDAMNAAKNAAIDSVNDGVTSALVGQKTYTKDDVAAHATREDCWTIIDGTVADVTEFFGKHPGGDDALAQACGVDATELFMSVAKHDPNGYAQLQKHQIGTLAEE
jgi:cytochrome b involved in lipid metabolism